MEASESNSLWTRLRSGDTGRQFLYGATGRVMLSALASGTAFPSGLRSLEGRSVLILAADQLVTALTLLELDGVALEEI